MKTLRFTLLGALLGSALVTNACSSSSEDDGVGGAGSTGATSPSTGTGASETVEVDADVTADTTWTSDKAYLLKGVVHVAPGATLTIEPGTTIFGDKATLGTLVVSQGGRLVADGTADQPIVFTSALPPGDRAAGDWGGVVILGRAPINEAGGTAEVEGFTSPEVYGGESADDDSGTLRYVRIEFSGIEIAADNEINGLTLAGVGRGTTIDHVMVKATLDDCFEFFGGTVDASHLVCFRNQDDAFDFDQGYVGRLQFLFSQSDPDIADEANGFEADNDKDDPTLSPVTNPTIYNVTLCGQGADAASQQYGFLFRRGFRATIGNAIVSGYEAGVDFRDVPPTNVTLTSSIFEGNAPSNVAHAEDGSNEEEQADDDDGFDEIAWFEEGEGNATSGAALTDCFAATPDPRPAATVTGEAPPDDGFFDAGASYVGAFEGPDDAWMTGAWVDFATE